MKTCTKCHTTKPLDEFYNARRARDGKASRCKECARAYSRAHHAANRNNPEFMQAIRDRSRARDAANPEARRKRVNEGAARRRARMRNLPSMPYTRDEIYERDKGTCRHCGIHVARDDWHLDHAVPLAFDHPSATALGDTAANAVVSCGPCNLSKSAHRADWHMFAENAVQLISEGKAWIYEGDAA